MDAVKILNHQERLDWDYDAEGDVLYVSLGKPRKATGIDIGDGLVVRYDERRNEVVGVTILSVRGRLSEQLKETDKRKRR
jgi:uncharacterized protein YuzE